MNAITSVVFDIGNVLVEWDPRNLYSKIIDDEDELDWFLSEVVTLDWHHEHDRGRPFKEGIAQLSQRFPEYGEWIEAFDTRWDETIGDVIDGTVAILEELVERETPVFAITNFSGEKFPQFKRQHAYTDLFGGIVVSGDEKLIKPDPRIFHVALTRFKLDPEATVFIDDRLDNVLAAEQLHMVGHHFTDPERLRLHLTQLGLL